MATSVIERINAGLNSDAPGRVEWRSLLETALFEIERLGQQLAKANLGATSAWAHRDAANARIEQLEALLRLACVGHPDQEIISKIDAALGRNHEQ